MRGHQRDRGGHLVHLARLDADEAVLDHVDPADAVASGKRRGSRATRSTGGSASSVERHRDAALEPDDDVVRFVRKLVVLCGHLVDVLGRWLRPRVLEHARLDGAAPEVLVDRERLVRRHRDRDPVLLARTRSPGRAASPSHGSARGSRAPARARRSTSRTAPGRCPSRCSRVRRPSRRAPERRARGAARSADATAPTRAGSGPRRARSP